MFDIGWTELLLIGIVALIVVGPKELPGMFRKMGQFTGKARAMARDFQRAMDSAADEAGVKDIQRDFRKMTSSSSLGVDDLEKSIKSGLNAADFTKDWSGNPIAPKTETDQPAAPAEKSATSAAKAPPASPVKKAAPRKAAATPKAQAAPKAAKPAPKARKSAAGTAPKSPPRSSTKAGSAPE